MERIDLHLHSRASDGGLSPAELIRDAAAARLGVIALTDHDTAAGVRELAAGTLPLRLIPGIEISASIHDREVHILGYAIDPSCAGILAHETRALAGRTDRMHRMIARLEALGVRITFEEVEEVAGPGAVLARPHLARALANRGVVSSPGEAFNRFIGDRGPAFAANTLVPAVDAVALIHAAGGVASWAHPGLETIEQDLPGMIDAGVDALECYRPRLQPIEVQMLEEYAKFHRLLRTGGSDWHGPWSAKLGEFHVTRRDIGDFLARCGI